MQGWNWFVFFWDIRMWEIKWYGSRSYIDKKICIHLSELLPAGRSNCMDDNMEVLADQVDVIFTATPQGCVHL